MTSQVSNEDILKALVQIGGGLHREFVDMRDSLKIAARSINEQKFQEAALLARELEELSQHIFNTKREIAMLVGGEAATPGARIISANYELDAIVQATEDATNNIMNAAEAIEAMASRVRGAPDMPAEERAAQMDAINDQVIKIFEHCNFQDITGQRISKVIKTLDYIETRIENMIRIWGKSNVEEVAKDLPSEEATGDAALLNGPQLPDHAATQTEIDQMFGQG
jgi:chemotaxis protein CheZ